MVDLNNRKNPALHSPENPALAGMSELEREEAVANARRGVTSRAKTDAYLFQDKKPH